MQKIFSFYYLVSLESLDCCVFDLFCLWSNASKQINFKLVELNIIRNIFPLFPISCTGKAQMYVYYFSNYLTSLKGAQTCFAISELLLKLFFILKANLSAPKICPLLFRDMEWKCKTHLKRAKTVRKSSRPPFFCVQVRYLQPSPPQINSCIDLDLNNYQESVLKCYLLQESTSQSSHNIHRHITLLNTQFYRTLYSNSWDNP